VKFIIEKKDLLSLLAKAQNIVEKRTTMPILVNILLDVSANSVQVFATDLEVSLTDKCPIKMEVMGKVAVNAKSLFDIVKELNDEPIHITQKPNFWVEIRQNKTVFNIVGINSDEYPVFPTYSTKEFMPIDAHVLKDMIEKTIYSVSHDETRYHLNGVYFEKYTNAEGAHYRMVATDGHRMSLVDRKSEVNRPGLEANAGVIIPRKGLNEIRKLIDSINGPIEMAIEGSQLVIRYGDTVLMIRLIEGKYPNYQQLIPQNLPEQISVRREELLQSLKRVSLLANQKSKGVTLTLSAGKMEITSNNPEMGDAKEEIDVNYKGKEFRIGFNAKYILDVLNSFDDEEVEIRLNDQLSPGLMRPKSDSHYTCVVMPMRI
jgi:DNA polymerase-3 subunit beta